MAFQMRAIYEFRVNEEFAHRLFRDDEGKNLGSVRLIQLPSDDPRLPLVGELQREIVGDCDRSFFFGWDIKYRYTKGEIHAAEVFHLFVTSAFEPVGENCGTIYDESAACPKCGAGAIQVSDLRLDLRKAPKSKDISRTIADIEIIVSQSLAERLVDSALTGFELQRVRHKARYEDDPVDLDAVPTGREVLRKAEAADVPRGTGKFDIWLNRPENRELMDKARDEYAAMRRTRAKSRGKPVPNWYQLVITSEPVDIASPTRTGVNPFEHDDKAEFRCPRGDTIGLNMLSEVHVSRTDCECTKADVMQTRQYIGTRRGYLRPRPLLIVSPRFRELIIEANVKGATFEVAYLE